MKKKNGSIALLFQRHEAKAKKIDVGSGIGSNQTPLCVMAVVQVQL